MNRAMSIGTNGKTTPLSILFLIAAALSLSGCYVDQQGRFAPWSGSACVMAEALGSSGGTECQDLLHPDREHESRAAGYSRSIGTPGPAPGPGPGPGPF